MVAKKPSPTDARTYYELGNDYYEKGDYDRAIENYNMAILLNPVFSEAYFNRALSYYQLKNFDKSVADYTKAIELDPHNPIIYNNRGDAYYRKQDFQSAIKDYDKAVSLNPNYLKAFYNRGLSYASIEEYEKAIEDFSKVIELKPDFAEAYHLRGLAREYAGEITNAITDYEKALELNPQLTEAKTHLESAKAKKEQEGKGEGGAAGADIRMLQKPNMTFDDVAGMKKMKEEIREAIVYPMMNPELARKYGKLGGTGILMYGPPGCGKCMTGETPVMLFNGEIKSIEEIYTQFLGLGEKKIGKYEWVIEKPSIELPSFNPKTLKIEKKEVEFIYRQKYVGKVYRIRTHSGRAITVTPEHPFISIQNGIIKTKAAEIRVGDYIAVPRILPSEPKADATEELVGFSEAQYFDYMLSEGSSIHGTMFFSNSDQNLIPRVTGLTQNLFLERAYAFKLCDTLPGLKPWASAFRASSCPLDTETPRPLVSRLGEKPCVTSAQNKGFGFAPPWFENQGFKQCLAPEVFFNNLGFSYELNTVSREPWECDSRNTKIPKSILTANLSTVSKFLSAFFECKASIKQDVPQIEFTTASSEFANGIAYLLLRFGIVAHIRPKRIKGNSHTYWRLYISSHAQLKIFERCIGFMSSKKISLLKKWTSRDISDTTKEIEKLRLLADSDVFWDKVESITEEDFEGYVYDLTVEGNHTFVAGFGGLIVHNTFIVKAAAGECKSGFINAKLSDLLDMYVGNTEKNIHKVFELARKNTPCILFFDEVDAIGGRRDQQEGQQYMRMAVNQLLYEMDGVEAHNENVLVLAATNAPWDVDPALRRSGRFSKTIYIPEPDLSSRAEILKLHASKRPLTPLIPFRLLALATMHYASSDLKAIVDDAATIPWKEAFFGIQKKTEELIKSGMPKEKAEELAKKQVKQRPISLGDFVSAIAKKRSSLPPWYEQAKKQIGKQEEITIIDGKEHKKITESKMGPGEKEAFRDLLNAINAKNQWYNKIFYRVVKESTLMLLRIIVLITERRIV